MLTAAGTSSEGGTIDAIEHTASNKMLRVLYRCYRQASGDGLYTLRDFKADTRNGHILNFVVALNDDCCTVGLELMHDDQGPYLSMLYAYGFIEAPMIGGILTACLIANAAYMEHEGYHPRDGRLWVKGRKGWRRVMRAHRIATYDDPFDGDAFWITGDQPLFHYVEEKVTVH
jgi:hypothetical protein